MKSNVSALLWIVVAGMLVAGVAGAQVIHEGSHDAKAVVAQTKCPVQGGDINKSLYADVDGKRIYVCCPGCIDTIKKNPQKYIKDLEAQGITLDKAK